MAKVEITKCDECGLPFPAAMGQCPRCFDRVSVASLSNAEMVARMSDMQVRYIFQQDMWEQGSRSARLACLAEYDKRFGLENWPAHISKEA